MAERPWLTIVGLGEDGPDGLPPASQAALAEAEVIMGARRHLDLLGPIATETKVWPVPFADGLPALFAMKGRQVVVLASGDPFWFGAGTVLSRALVPSEWRALPGPACFSLAAAALGWAQEDCQCLGLHAAPLTRLRPHLAPRMRLLVTLRDGAAVADLAAYLEEQGFGASDLHICEALGGPRQRITQAEAYDLPDRDFAHPVLAAIEIRGTGKVVTGASGRDDALFASDGQMTKRPMRALALSALAPRPHERLWDIGGGSGSIAVEWLLSHGSTQAISIEAQPERAERIRANALALGVDRLRVVTGTAPDALAGLPAPDAVFIGGGLSHALLETLWETCAKGTRLVAHGVTLEAEAILADWQGAEGGDLMRVALSHAGPLGEKTAWQAAYPVVQWRVTT